MCAEPAIRWHQDPSRVARTEPEYSTQQWWSDQLADASLQSLYRTSGMRDVTRLTSQQGPIASAWLTVVPGKQGVDLLNDVDFRSLARYWLRLPLLPTACCLPPCPSCGDALDPFGDHFVSCRKNLMVQKSKAQFYPVSHPPISRHLLR